MRARTYLGWALSLSLGCGNSVAPAGTDAGGLPEASPPAAGALSLAAGEVAELSLSQGRASVRLSSPLGTEKFVLVVASTKLDSSKDSYTYTVTGGAPGSSTDARLATGCSLDSPWKDRPVQTEPEPSGAPPAVGATRTLIVPVGNRRETITAEVVAVSSRAVVWKDTTPAHPATLEPAFTADFLADFDRTLLPRERSIFGVESDVDGDGRVGLVFSPLTRDSAVAFFSQCDLLEGTPGCGAGNRGEFLYLTPPANIAPPYNTPAAIKEILAHELGHLHHFNRKVLRNKLTSWPDSSYMIEGFGGFAQDVIGYQSGNLYVAKAGLDGIGDSSLADVLGARSTYDSKRDGALRGVGYLFVRYAYDRAGGDSAKADGTLDGRGGTAFLRDVLDAKESVAARMASMASLADISMDFYTALALSNGEKGAGSAPKNPCFAFAPVQTDPVTGKPRGADLHASFHGQQMKGPKTQELEAADGTLRSGGVELLVFDARAGAPESGAQVTIDEAALPRVRVARVK